MSVPFGPSGETVYKRTYSRPLPDGSHEEWPDTVRRVARGNLALVHGDDVARWPIEAVEEYNDLVAHMDDFRLIPAGRHLWASGVKGRQYLFNCVSGGTMVHTDTGIHRIDSLTGQTVNVLSQDATYRPATFYTYGAQETFDVVLSSGETFEATAAHEWVTYNSGKAYRHTTADLLGKYVPYNVAPRPDEDDDYARGVAWGMVYGDGTVVSTRTASIPLFGDKVALAALAAPFGTSVAPVHDKSRADSNVRVNGLPIEWKLTMPALTAPRSLWRGFIAGLLATDGYVDSGGCATIYSADDDALAYIAKGAAYAGLPARSARMVREFSPYDGTRKPCFAMTLSKWALTSRDILRDEHRANFTPTPSSVRSLKVVDVRPTGRVEPVYCCTEEETHTMTIGSGILTGQCHVSGWGEEALSRHFEFTFLRLMEGGGVGANYSSRYLERYGSPRRALDVHVVCDPSHDDYEAMMKAGVLSPDYSSDWDGAYLVEDSREGWADAMTDLVDTYMTDEAVAHTNRVYDVTNVRPRGARLKTFGGTASGPLPFATMLESISATLNGAHGRGQGAGHLTPLEAMDIDHAIAECVVSGGVRRSARMSIVHWDDPYVYDFLEAKEDGSRHWTTNISVEVDDSFLEALDDGDARAHSVLEEVSRRMLDNGEPGFWNSTLSNVGEVNEVIATNPCGEIALEPWENCNLGHVNLAAFDGPRSRAAIEHAHRLMARFLIRATFGDVNDDEQAARLADNRRIGVGHLGVQGYLAKRGIRYSEATTAYGAAFPEHLRSWSRAVREEARAYAFSLRVPEPVKVTTVAPTGSIAKLPGVSEGIHPIYARYFIRRIRFNTTDPAQAATVEAERARGLHVEADVYDASGNTVVVEYPTKDSLVAEVEALGYSPDVVETAADLTLDEMLAMQALYQRDYADNAVSFTANVKPGSLTPRILADTLEEYLPYLKGTTLMVDESRAQAPYERISEADFAAYDAFLRSVADGIDEECATGACPVR